MRSSTSVAFIALLASSAFAAPLASVQGGAFESSLAARVVNQDSVPLVGDLRLEVTTTQH